jgi:NitT/TauT family transport system substrate-binding protein
MKKRHLPFTLLLAILVLFASACGTSTAAGSGSDAPSSFSIVYQPGLGAAIFISLKLQKTLDKQFPNTNFQWKIVNSGAAVREAVLSGQGQIGSLGLPPFLVGWDKGMDWKVLLATSRSDAWLVAKDPKFKSLKDFGPNDKIGVVAPDSQQAIELRKFAQEQLGNAHALDKNMIAIGAADGEAALLSGQIAAQLSGPPFQNREVAEGAHIIVHSQDAFGPVGAGLIVLPESFYNQYPAFSKKVYQDLEESSAYVANHHDEVAQELAQDKVSGGGGTAAQFKTLLNDTSLVFDTTPSGLIAYSTFMKSIGLISKVPASVSDLELPTVVGTGN